MTERFFHNGGRVFFRAAPGRTVIIPTKVISSVESFLEDKARLCTGAERVRASVMWAEVQIAASDARSAFSWERSA
jgi:hypothetical protein